MKLDQANIRAYAETLVMQCRPAGLALDYSRDSLGTLEALLDGSHASWNGNAANPDHRNLAVFYAGCYLGETLVSLQDGQWEFAPAWQESIVRFPSMEGDLVVAPFDVVVRRMQDGPEGNEFVQLERSIALLRRSLPLASDDSQP